MIAHREILSEARRVTIQAAIDATKSAGERNRLGQFATPNALAIEIARYVDSLIGDDRQPLRFADPSVGSGSFFSAALAVYGRRRIASAVGIELDPAFAEVARELWGSYGLEVVCGDFTEIVATAGRPPRPNLILANPPYVRHHHMERGDKQRLQAITRDLTGVEVNGLAGLYVYFLLLATAWMEDDGLAAWLIPSEFMDVNYGSSLKRFLSERVTLIRAHRFEPDDVQFGDALVSSVVLVFRKATPPAGHEVEFTFGGTIAEPHARDHILARRLGDCRKWTAFPSHSRNDRHAAGDGSGPTLGDLFRIQRGIATGGNEFFVLDRADAQRRGFPETYLRPILPSPRLLDATTIEADADGYPRIDRQLCLIDCDLPEYTVEKRYPALWEYLQTAESLGIRNRYLVSKRRPWYRQEQREPSPFLCTYMGRGADERRPFRFIYNRSQAIGTNLYLMLYPRHVLASMLGKHPDCGAEVHELLGRITGHELRGEGRVYGGGLNKIEPSELGRVSASTFVERWPELARSVHRPEMEGLFG